jgi:amidase
MKLSRTLAVAIAVLLLGSVLPAQQPARGSAKAARFDVFEASIADMQAAMKSGRTTSHEIVQQYLTRVAKYEDLLHAAITVNPKALEEADALDRERAQGRVRGPLHGIPIALKDNIHTTNMRTTGGALAFEWLAPPYEATLTKNLRDAGAVIIAKTGMTELANYVAANMPTNYNAVHGYGMNPYDPRRDPRSDGRPILQTGGSSSGVGTAANFWAGNVGTETSGSILSPSNQNMLAAVKPTVGRISRYGVIPITADQDTPGPMAKYVWDVAAMLGALESASADPNDDATKVCTPPPGRDYTKLLRADALKGARIGIPRAFYYEPIAPPGLPLRFGGLDPDEASAMEEAIAVLKEQGAVIVDPADIPSIVDQDPNQNSLHWQVCRGAGGAKGMDAGCSVVFKYGMKRDFNKWLASLGPAAPVKTLTELRQWNLAHAQAGALKYGQSQLDISDEMDIEGDRERYAQDRTKDIALSATHGIDEIMRAERLDALLFPAGYGALLSARPGYPTVIVPFGMVANVRNRPLPPDFEAKPSPFGVSFAGGACSEPRLIALAYAFEQATKRRVPPASAP